MGNSAKSGKTLRRASHYFSYFLLVNIKLIETTTLLDVLLVKTIQLFLLYAFMLCRSWAKSLLVIDYESWSWLQIRFLCGEIKLVEF